MTDSAYICPMLGDCKKNTAILTGRKCPADHGHVGVRPPRAPLDGSGNFKCPTGSKAVKIMLGHTTSGSDIFFDFGKTQDKDFKKKRICKSPKGRFKSGSGTDPYISKFVLKKATQKINKKLLNKKVVRVMGYAKGMMCVHKRPRMQVIINDAVMNNIWGGANANKWSIEPGCIDKDGSQGKDVIAYQGKKIDPLNKYSDYGTCSMRGNELACHQSNDFDSGKSDADDGHPFFFPSAFDKDNIIKLRLACDANNVNAVAGVLNTDCFVATRHWIQVNVYTYRKQITIYNKYTQTLCKCNPPRSAAYQGITYSGATKSIFHTPNDYGTNTDSDPDNSQANAETGSNKGKRSGDFAWFPQGTDQKYNSFNSDPCVLKAGFAQCKAGYGLGTSGCSGHSPNNVLQKYGVSMSDIKPGSISCHNGPLGNPFVDRSSIKGSMYWLVPD